MRFRYMAFAMLILADISFSQSISIDYAIKEALKNNLAIKAKRYDVKSKEYELESVKGMLFPRLSLQTSFNRTNIAPWSIMNKMDTKSLQFPQPPPQFFQASSVTPQMLGGAFQSMQDFFNNPGASQLYQTQLTLQIPIWMGGKVQAYESASYHALKSTKKELNQTEQDIVYNVYKAYLGGLLAKEGIKLATQAVNDAKKHVDMAESYYKTGMALFSDTLRAKVYLHQAEQKLVEAKNNYKTAKRALFLLMDEPYKDVDLKGNLYCPSHIDKEALIKAVYQKPQIKSMEEKLRALKSMKRAYLADYLPQIGAFGSYSLFDNSTPFGATANGYMVGVGVNWNIFDGLTAFNKIRSLNEQKLMLSSYIDYMAKGSIFKINKALADYENALAMMKYAKKEEEEAKATLKVMDQRYKVGLAKITDVIDAETQYDKARFDFAKAMYDCNLAYIKSLYQAGLLNKEVK
ncbi:MAG: TolC family protein [Hydrogenobaculum sp.]